MSNGDVAVMLCFSVLSSQTPVVYNLMQLQMGHSMKGCFDSGVCVEAKGNTNCLFCRSIYESFVVQLN